MVSGGESANKATCTLVLNYGCHQSYQVSISHVAWVVSAYSLSQCRKSKVIHAKVGVK